MNWLQITPILDQLNPPTNTVPVDTDTVKCDLPSNSGNSRGGNLKIDVI